MFFSDSRRVKCKWEFKGKNEILVGSESVTIRREIGISDFEFITSILLIKSLSRLTLSQLVASELKRTVKHILTTKKTHENYNLAIFWDNFCDAN